MEDGREGSNECRYTLPGVLHFLQHDWSRFELERVQWDAEKAELTAKIAFLQGERRGQENIKRDLIRRIKMLEFALKKERIKGIFLICSEKGVILSFFFAENRAEFCCSELLQTSRIHLVKTSFRNSSFERMFLSMDISEAVETRSLSAKFDCTEKAFHDPLTC